jgi:2-hydroxy-6-oxonona-2,4-dienedioate hydrolase
MTTTSQMLTEEATGHTIEVDGTTIHYHDVGSGDPILLLQPWGPQPGVTAWLTLQNVLGPLSEHYRCIAMDLVNYGRTGPIVYNAPYHHVVAETAIKLLDHLKLSRVPVIGSSQGATTAIVLGLEYPDRVASLVIGSCHASTGGDPYLLGPFPSEAGRAMRRYNRDRTRANLEVVMQSIIHDETLITTEVLDALEAQRDAAPEHTEANRQSQGINHSNLAELNHITVPTLIVHGRFDRMVPIEQGLMLFSYIRSSQFIGLNNCGHWPTFEQPAEYASHVLRFLRSTAA